MALSDREQRVLDDMERSLHATDPRLAASMVDHRPKPRVRRAVVLAAVGALAGLVFVLVGLAMNLVIVSVFGYVLTVAALVIVTDRRNTTAWLTRLKDQGPPRDSQPK